MNTRPHLDRINRLQQVGNIGNWELDFATGKAIWSAETCHIYGLAEEDNVKTFDEWEGFIHPDDKQQVRATYEQSVSGNKSYSIQHRIIRRNGSVAHVYTHVDYILNNDGQPIGLYGITNDITDVVRLKTELVKSEGNIRLMMNLLPISIYARDADGYYIFANHVFLRHYGITYEDLAGKHLRDFVRNEEEYRILSEQDQQVLKSEDKLLVAEFRQTDHLGVEKMWRITKVPFTPEGHDKKAVLGIAEDITERHQNQANLQRFARSLEQRNRALEEYSRIVSHELRGPLSTIMGVSDMVKNFSLSQEEIAYFLKGLDSSLAKLDAVIHKMNVLLNEKDSQ